VHVKDAAAERAYELHVVDALVAEVRGVVVEPEAPVALDGVHRALRACRVEGNLGGMDLQAEVDVACLERLEDRAPPARKVLESLLPELLGGGREGVDRVPDRRTREAVDDRGKIARLRLARAGVEEPPRRLRRRHHLRRGAPADALGLSIAPHVRGEYGLVAAVDQVADGLSDEVV